MPRTLTAWVYQDGDAFVAQCREVNVASQGATEDEALRMLQEALELYFEDETPRPTPSATLRAVELRAS